MCDLCHHDQAITGRKLCAVCLEAIGRLANAVNAIEAKGIEVRPMALAAQHGAEEYGAAFFANTN